MQLGSCGRVAWMAGLLALSWGCRSGGSDRSGPSSEDTDLDPDSGGGDDSAGDDTDAPVDRPLAVFLLTGQSNSLGTTAYEGGSVDDYGPGAHDADAATPFFWSNVNGGNDQWPPILYGDSDGAFLDLQIQQGFGSDPAFWGPEFGFARTLHDAGYGDITIIKSSRGGGGNTYWVKEAFEESPSYTGDMWGQLSETTTLALGALVAAGTDFEVVGLLYLQGESNNAEEAELTGVRLLALKEDLTELIDGIAPGAADDMRLVLGEIAASSSTPERILTTEQQRALANEHDDIDFVETSDLPLKSDGIHFGKDEKLEIGRRFAAVFLEG